MGLILLQMCRDMQDDGDLGFARFAPPHFCVFLLLAGAHKDHEMPRLLRSFNRAQKTGGRGESQHFKIRENLRLNASLMPSESER